MNTKHNPFVKNTTAFVAAGALATGLLLAGAPAATAGSNPVTQPSLSQAATSSGNGEVEARFWAEAATVVDVTAGAVAVAIAGVDVTGKILLEEVRTVDSNHAVRNVKLPSKKEVRQAPTIHSQEEGQALATRLVTKYKNKVAEAKLRVTKLKLKLKHADSHKEKVKFKRQLKKAKKQLKRTRADVPRMKAAHGVEFLNSGYRDRRDLQLIHDRVNGRYDVFEYVPAVDDFVIIVKIALDGTWDEGCHNYVGFVIPPGTPAAEMFIIVRNALEVEATVTANYTEEIALTVGGELVCPDGTVKTGTKTETTTKSDSITKTKSARSVEEAIRFGEELIKLHRKERVGVEAEVSGQLVNKIGAELNLKCPAATMGPGGVLNEINDVVEYNSRPVGFTLSGVAGETLQVVAYAKHGGTITGGKTQSITLDSNGNATGSLTYKAGEVPKTSLTYEIDGRPYTIAAGHDVVWLQIRDPRGNEVWVKSNDFQNRAAPPESE